MEKLELNIQGLDNFLVQEAYKFIRTNIQFCGSDMRTIALTSCNENEGKTTVSIYIAKSFAELGKKVLLIDADMRKSVLAGRNFKVPVVAGLSELLSGIEKNINNCIYGTTVDNLYLLLAGKYPPNPAELLNSKYFDSIINATRQSFDYIIIDTPPLGAVTDAAIIASKVDGTVLVIGSDKVDREQAQEVVSQLRSSGTKLLGAIRNNMDEKKKSYYRKGGKYYKHYYKHSDKTEK